MATKLLLLCGLLLVNSSDLSKGHVSAKSLNTTPDASKFLDNQTDLMEAEIDQSVQWTNMTFVNSNLLSSPDKPQKNGTHSCLFINLTKCSMGQTKQQATSKSAVFDFEDPAGLDCVGADQSLEEKPDHLYENYDTINSSSNFSGIRSLNCTLKQFKNEHIGISTGDISGSMPQMNSFRPDVTLTFTCKGRCGMEISFPCSCSASCVVYGTCCDNMTQDCPHIWEEGMTRFDNLLRAYTICYENFVYMISSCPKSPRKNADRKEVIIPTTREPVLKNVRNTSESQSPIFDTVVTTSGTKDVIGLNSAEFSRSGGDIEESIVEKLRNILSAAPVTDSDTGFTFINKSIYDCNNMSQNTALIWSVESAYTVISPTKVEDLERFNILDYYQFEFDKQVLKAHQCKKNVIETCNQTAGLDDFYLINAEKCQKSYALVTSTFSTHVFYRNIFCAYCNEGSHDKYSLFLFEEVILRHQGFQVLMSISKTGTINVRLFQSGRPSAMLPWSHAHCPIPHHNINLSISSELEGSANAESDQQDVCSVTCQGRYFKAQSDGLCKTQHSALLAIADDGSSPLCPAAMRGLANFLMCGLKSQVETLSHADLKSQSVSVMFDASTNKKLYVVEINLALLSITDQMFSSLKGDAMRNIYHVALLMKSFENYRSSRVLCSRQSLSDQNSELRVIHSSSIESYLRMIKLDIALSEGMEELRGPIVDRQNTTTVCLTTVHIAKNVKPDYLYCMEDPVHERDATLLHGFRNSPCFSLVKNLEVPRGSNGAVIVMKSTGSFLMWTILIIVLVKATQLP